MMPRQPTAFLAALALLALGLPAQPADAPVLPLADVRPGLKGQVWTVFKGSQPEPFEVVVTGTVQNALGPGKSLIVCELTDERVQKMGAVAGMSGSPLYLDGKLAGVLSYQLQRFETVRYAGFTPIGDMIEVSQLPESPLTPAPLPFKDLRDGKRTAASTPLGDFQPLTPVFATGGLAPQVAAMLEPEFRAAGLNLVTLGGNTNTGASAPAASVALHPGDAVGVALAVGDITIASSGTVSRVDGGRILAFGHPMLSLGNVELPMTSAEVVTILPSQMNSQKVSNIGGIIGTISQDRLSGVYGELGRTPALLPVEVAFPTRATRGSLRFQSIKHELLTPMIVSAAILQAINGSNEAGFSQGFRLRSTIDFEGLAPLTTSQVYAGVQGFQQALNEFTRDLAFIAYNPFAKSFPRSLYFALEPLAQNPTATLDQWQVSRSRAGVGESVVVSLTWRGFQQEARRASAEFTIPADWAGRKLEVVLLNGPQLDELAGLPRAVAPAQLRDFDEYLATVRRLRDNVGLYLAVVERTALFYDQLSTTRQLPGSFERIARASDEARFQSRAAYSVVWEQRLLPGQLFVNPGARRTLDIEE
jgi:hypothetical protein